MRPKTLLPFWIFAIIFPLAWFIRFIRPVRHAFNILYGMEWLHILTHLILFACLAILISLSFPEQATRQSIIRLGVWVLLVGAIQEGLQHLTHSTSPGLAPSLFDLAVDLLGAGLGFWFLQKYGPRAWNFLKLIIVKG